MYNKTQDTICAACALTIIISVICLMVLAVLSSIDTGDRDSTPIKKLRFERIELYLDKQYNRS